MNICQFCEIEFEPKSSSIGVYCSRACSNRRNIGKITRPMTSATVVCKECSVEFLVQQCILKRGGGIFCGHGCSSAYNSRHYKRRTAQ